ncbi:MAG: hypothetical protein M1817_005271 [Caeruleum heppii]|nr:MAG: hypothetical protein M1817_005271 [Caeruleum heppii]
MSLLTPEAFVASSYDYVIAGGGTAGLTLAARLSEDPKVSVAVIEAGDDRTEDILVNSWGLTTGQLGNPDYDWIFKTTPQSDDNNRVIAWPRGRQLGGSSAINLQLWNHASRSDIDNWGELGNQGWTWDELVPYFLRSETYTPPSAQVARDLNTSYINPVDHGTSGPVQVSFPTVYSNYSRAWSPTFNNLGLGVDGDPFGGLALGGYTTPISQEPDTVTRSYAAKAYYKPNAARPNLKVLTKALVNNIVFDDRGNGKGKRTEGSRRDIVATGANFTSAGRSYVVKAKREVILSAGVVQSPQLLELSGIGSKRLLESLGITVRIDNPNVGENLQDHAQTSLGFDVVDGLPTLDSLADPAVFGAALNEWTTNRTGLLAEAACSTSYLSYDQLIKSTRTKSTLPKDEKAYKPSREALAKNPGLAKQYELITRKLRDPHEATAQQIFLPSGVSYQNADNVTLLFRSPGPGAFLTFYGVAVHPYSRGSIHVQSADPTVYPVIDPRYLSNPLDLDVLTSIAFSLQTIASTQPFASLLKGNGTEYEIGYEKLTPQNVRQHVKKTLNTLYHGIGTCAMEPRDKGGVVDARLKVYGTKNLRVVDGSVAPLLTRGTIQSFVYAIAEKAADMIKADAKR